MSAFRFEWLLFDLLGQGSFDAGAEAIRFAVLLGGSSCVADVLRRCWDGLRAEMQCKCSRKWLRTGLARTDRAA